MRSAVVAIVFFNDAFPKIFVKSFRKYYPKHPLIIVDNNVDDSKEGSRFVKNRDDVIYVRHNNLTPESCSWGHGIDVAFRFAYYCRPRFDMLIHIDIDSVFLKKGIVEECENAFNQGFLCGGYFCRRKPDELFCKNKTWQLHSAFCFYSVDLINHLKISFRHRGDYNDGHVLGFALNGMGVIPKPMAGKDNEYLLHCGSGSYLYFARQSKKTNRAAQRQERFLGRKEVKPYL